MASTLSSKVAKEGFYLSNVTYNYNVDVPDDLGNYFTAPIPLFRRHHAPT